MKFLRKVVVAIDSVLSYRVLLAIGLYLSIIALVLALLSGCSNPASPSAVEVRTDTVYITRTISPIPPGVYECDSFTLYLLDNGRGNLLKQPTDYPVQVGCIDALMNAQNDFTYRFDGDTIKFFNDQTGRAFIYRNDSIILLHYFQYDLIFTKQ